jgi:hypothetical protein
MHLHHNDCSMAAAVFANGIYFVDMLHMVKVSSGVPS